MNCDCGSPATHGKECRGCYENRLRHEAIDAYDGDPRVRARMMLHKARCRRRLYKNYDGPSDARKP